MSCRSSGVKVIGFLVEICVHRMDSLSVVETSLAARKEEEQLFSHASVSCVPVCLSTYLSGSRNKLNTTSYLRT